MYACIYSARRSPCAMGFFFLILTLLCVRVFSYTVSQESVWTKSKMYAISLAKAIYKLIELSSNFINFKNK